MQNPSTQPARISGATIAVPALHRSPSPTHESVSEHDRLTPDEYEQLQDVLYRVAGSFGPADKKPARVRALIEVCLTEGCHLKRDIISVISKMGFKPGHVAMVLDKSAGIDPESHPWRLVSKGVYELQRPL